MKKITAYQCDYCPKYYKHDSSASRHEKECFYNPATKSCITCENYDNSSAYTTSDDLPACKAGLEFGVLWNGRVKLRTNCDQWKLR